MIRVEFARAIGVLSALALIASPCQSQAAQSAERSPPPYRFGSPIGFACGSERFDVPDTLVGVIDVVLDSLDQSSQGELQFSIHFAAKEGRPNLSASMEYTPTGRRAGAGCPWASGVTFRINVRQVSVLVLNAVATGSVRVVIRDMAGRVLAGPITVLPGDEPKPLQWVSGAAQPNEELKPTAAPSSLVASFTVSAAA